MAEALGRRAGAKGVQLDTGGEVDGRPVSYGSRWFPARLFPDFEQVYRAVGSGSITRVMEAHGFGDYERAVTKVTARMPDAVEAEQLDNPRTRAILYVESLNVAADGGPVEGYPNAHAAVRFPRGVE